MTLKIEVETINNGYVVSVGIRKNFFTTHDSAIEEVVEQLRLLLNRRAVT